VFNKFESNKSAVKLHLTFNELESVKYLV